MKLILLGPPGVGKGTQANLLSDKFGIPKISTGDILRRSIEKKTDLGMKAQHFMNAGKLVPDEVVVDIFKSRLSEKDCQKGFILDGFPRTKIQAEALNEITDIDDVISLNAKEREVILRLEGRRTCKTCGSMFHVQWNPPKKNDICNDCGEKLIQRQDDERETIRRRLKEYNRLTHPLIEYYRNLGLLKEIDGIGSIQDVFQRMLLSIKS